MPSQAAPFFSPSAGLLIDKSNTIKLVKRQAEDGQMITGQKPSFQKLPYQKPRQSKDYFLKDKFFENAQEIRERCLARTDWTLGFPHRKEMWPGMRSAGGLLPAEMEQLEEWVKKKTGAKRLWQQTVEGENALSHNYIQVVGEKESGARPHTDSRKLCRYAGVIYLNPEAPRHGGTTFYRLRHPDGTLDGNICPDPHYNLREALGVQKMPIDAWKEDLEVENIFNRVIVYDKLEDKRMTIVFFWMAE